MPTAATSASSPSSRDGRAAEPALEQRREDQRAAGVADQLAGRVRVGDERRADRERRADDDRRRRAARPPAELAGRRRRGHLQRGHAPKVGEFWPGCKVQIGVCKPGQIGGAARRPSRAARVRCSARSRTSCGRRSATAGSWPASGCRPRACSPPTSTSRAAWSATRTGSSRPRAGWWSRRAPGPRVAAVPRAARGGAARPSAWRRPSATTCGPAGRTSRASRARTGCAR